MGFHFLWTGTLGLAFVLLPAQALSSTDRARRETNSRSENGSVTIGIGKFTKLGHGCESGQIKILDERTVEIANLTYDGTGPAAYFVVGTGNKFRREYDDLRPITVAIPEDYGCKVLPKYTGETVIIELPRGRKIQNYKFLSMYCLKYDHNFCYVKIPAKISPQKPPVEATGPTECSPQYLKQSRVKGRSRMRMSSTSSPRTRTRTTTVKSTTTSSSENPETQ